MSFRFKQFLVQQDKTAMKVCTDACLFGAWAAKEIEQKKKDAANILDIGTGTGLLSLMLAQKTRAKITAVEMDQQAALQAKENFAASKWSNRLSVHQTTIQEYATVANNRLFDIIISNPPFFENSLRSDNNQNNLAKHSPSLPFDVLSKLAGYLLKDDGYFFILLPYREFDIFVNNASSRQLFLHTRVNIRQTPKHNYFRSMGCLFKIKPNDVATDSIIIKQEDNQYTSAFIQLLKDYYLYL